MFGLLSRWKRPRLVISHLDNPVEGQQISNPQLEVRGWLAFDKTFDRADLSVSLDVDGQHKPLVLERRVEVEAGLPEQFIVGFNRLFDIGELGTAPQTMSIGIRFPGGGSNMPLKADFVDDVSQKSSYYISRFDEPSVDDIEAEWPGLLETWQKDGYAILRGYYSATEVGEINGLIEQLWESRESVDPCVTVDEYIGSDMERRLAFRDANRDIRDKPYKLNDLYLVSQPMRELLLDERLSPLLAALLSGTPMICNSLYFERGSQQQDHFDTFFMPPLMRNRMLATWIALEDVSPEAGPLKYYPGSHRIEPYRFRNGRFNLVMEEKEDCYAYIDSELEKERIEPVSFCPARGDLFIWHAQLLHGGEQIKNSGLTRRSLVTHYFCAEDWARDDSVEFSPGRYYLTI